MSIIFTSQKLVLNAYALLAGAAPGSVNLTTHLDFINAPGVGKAGYVAELNQVVVSMGETTASLAAKMLANLGLGAVFTQADAEAYLNANAANRVGAMLDLADLLTGYNGGDAAVLAAKEKYVGAIGRSFDYSQNPANLATTALVYEVVAGDLGLKTLLTSGLDSLVGSATAKNHFVADLVDNGNTFNSGDSITGGTAVDTLTATLGNASNFAIRATTSNIENFFFTSQAANLTGNTGDNEVQPARNVVDAELFTGVKQLWSDNSRADLVVEDVRAFSSATTVGMRNTDAGGVDYHVYYDNQYITDAGSAQGLSTLQVDIVNSLNLAKSGEPTKGLTGVEFTVGGKLISAVFDKDVYYTYAEVISGISAALTAAGVADVAVSSMLPTNAYFAIAVEGYAAGSLAGTYTPILISSSSSVLTAGKIDATNVAGVPAATWANDMKPALAPDVPSLTQTNVVLDNVGRDSKSGDLEIGAMSQSGYSGSKGIEQFNIDVQRSSWLNEVRSTNDTLEVLHIENIAIGNLFKTAKSEKGDLRIDNLTDVRVVDAASMTGALRLSNVQLTDEIVKKYLELKDDNTDPSNDNSVSINYAKPGSGTFAKDFNYTTGAGADHINMAISASNLAVLGTASREDFELAINTGAGDDRVELRITDAGVLAGNAISNWYSNHQINNFGGFQIQIDAGNGNNTVWTEGAGDFRIVSGTGNDTIYTDNAGRQGGITTNDGKATWTLNALGTIDDLQSDVAATVNAVNAQLQVSFQGYESAVTTIANSVGSLTNVAITDLHINQAIKAAINNNDVLNKLLVAEDGPGRTLVVRSLIDGTMVASDLQITFSNQALSVTQAAQVVPPTVFAGAQNALLDGYVGLIGQTVGGTDDMGLFAVEGVNVDGADSTFESNNLVNAGSGNDVVVLGTGALSTELVEFNASFGNKVIVNFTAQDAGATLNNADVLDFSGSWGAIANDTAALDANLTAGEVAIVTAAGLDGATLAVGDINWSTISSLTLAQVNEAFNSTVVGGPVSNQSYLLMVQQSGAGSEQDTFAVFQLVSNTSTADFTAVNYQGTIELLGVDAAALAANAANII